MADREQLPNPAQEPMYGGRTFEQFSALPDHIVSAMHASHEVLFGRAFEDRQEEEGSVWELADEMESWKLMDFMTWRATGGPPRHLSPRAINGFMKDLVEIRVAKDNEYGQIPQSYFAQSRPARARIASVFGYLMEHRDPAQHLQISTSTLIDKLDFNTPSLTDLRLKRVVESRGVNLDPMGEMSEYFELTDDYGAHYLRSLYSPDGLRELIEED